MPINITSPSEVIEQDRHRVNVLRSEVDCTNKGVTSRHNAFMLCRNREVAEELVKNGVDAETILLLDLRFPNYPRAEPYVNIRDEKWSMFGGNYVVSCDSRYTIRLPIPVMDRVEA